MIPERPPPADNLDDLFHTTSQPPVPHYPPAAAFKNSRLPIVESFSGLAKHSEDPIIKKIASSGVDSAKRVIYLPLEYCGLPGRVVT